MTAAASLVGAVLAGGRSARMGRDKAEITVAGEPLWRRQVRILTNAGASPVALVRRPDQSDLGAAACWRDRRSESGPMAGLEAALIEAQRLGAAHVAVLAADMPHIDSAWFESLRRLCAPGRGAMGRHEAAAEPLAAIYPVEALPEVARRLDQAALALQDLARALAHAGQIAFVTLSPDEARAFRSANTPADIR